MKIKIQNLHRFIEIKSENLLFFSRWFLAPVFLIAPISIVVIGVKYCQELYHLIRTFWVSELDNVLVSVLQMLDMILVMGLVIIVMFSGYENFVSKLDVEDHPDNPKWMRNVTFAKMKIWLIATIVAMSSIHLLIDFYKIDEISNRELVSTLAIHLVLVITAIGMAGMDKILHSCDSHQKEEEE